MDERHPPLAHDGAPQDPAPPSPGPSIASFGIVLAMFVAGALVAARLPADARVATHFDATGHADGWMPPLAACLVMPGVALALLGVQALLPRIDPRGDNLRRSARAYRTIWLATLVLLAAVHGMVLWKALGAPLDVPRAMFIGLGALFIVMGNVFGKLRRNYTVGIRTPWTLASERVWDHTHRFAGRCFVLGGLALAVAGIADAPATWLGPLLVGGIGTLVALVCWRSWRLWRDEQPAA